LKPIVGMRYGLFALLALATSYYPVDEMCASFRQSTEVQSSPGISSWDVAKQITDWCIEAILAEGWSASEGEALADEISDEVLRRARAVRSKDSWRGVEAFYFSTLVMAIGDFCTTWDALGGTYADTPLASHQSTLIARLHRDYGLDLAIPSPAWKVVMDEAQDLASLWRTWARQPHPLLG